ncbi:MAG: hypothetical protein K8M05_18780 [Deltaproteobacteria bacterium]|nr:hypothetical protein [Kofleriaceae bacterium]
MSSRTMRCTRGLLALLLLSVTFSSGRTEQETAEAPPLPIRDPFTLYDADPGAVEWEDMSEEERANTNRTLDWAETQHGADVHNAFAAASSTTNQLRLIEDAQNTSNLDGIESLGVVP